ncbi:CDP-glycerol glycerophosphotransferase family protein [Microbulbifer variabilis]|uniref:CDP-glycerol glycerophosphotransferase family protein n=1 Tax=Microbulbifer variabilis TaxID=266805 RepID=A0ABY4V9L1_9GAMM|nr:glycosyltransferase [Microbulbifer variabilis]USD19898.1 CDP-glycerol glycerophosphotransferase family protein [Microbulbifer variabilis]
MKKQKVIKILHGFLHRYKPIDSRLRRIRGYQLLSKFGRKIYHNAVIRLSSSQRFYLENFDEIGVKKNVILFESHWGKNISCHPFAIYQALIGHQKAEDFSIIWVVNNPESVPAEISCRKNVKLIARDTIDYAKALLKAEYLVNNLTFPDYFIRKPSQFYVNTWHGIPIKTLGLDTNDRLFSFANGQRNFIQATHIPLAGEYAKKTTVDSYGAKNLNSHKVCKIGSPRIDTTLNTSRKSVLKRLGINYNKKVVLFAPTWRGRIGKPSMDFGFAIKALDHLSISLSDEYHVLVSLHGLVKEKLKGSLKGGFNFVPDEMDINEILAGVDILISDYSSITLDFFALNRPIILYVPDRSHYESERGLYIELEELPAKVVNELPELSNAIHNAVKPSEFPSYTAAVGKFIPNEDGKSSERLLSILFGSSQNLPVKESTKKKILVHPGGLLANGISNSFVNLVENIDHSKYEMTFIVDAKATDSSIIRKEYFVRLAEKCQVILLYPGIGLTFDEAKAYSKFTSKETNPSCYDEELINAAFRKEARRVFSDNSFDIAIYFSGYTFYWAQLFAHLDTNKRVIYQHCDMYAEASNSNPNRSLPQLNAVFSSYKHYETFVSVSDSVRIENERKLKSFYPSKYSTVTIENSISPSDIKRKSEIPLSLVSIQCATIINTTDHLKFVVVGRLSPEKNHKRLFRAFSILIKEEKKKAILFVVGDGPLREILKSEVRQLGIAEYVVFTGRLANPYPLVKACDCMVLASDYEGQGLVLLEALTLGVPCIGTNVPGIKCVLKDGIGILTETTANSFADAMITFANTPKKKPVIGFSAENYVASTLDSFYRYVCDEKISNDVVFDT